MKDRDQTGILSVYNTPTCLNTTEMEDVYRVIHPLKCFKNLVTSICSVAVNNDNTLDVYKRQTLNKVLHNPKSTLPSVYGAIQCSEDGLSEM